MRTPLSISLVVFILSTLQIPYSTFQIAYSRFQHVQNSDVFGIWNSSYHALPCQRAQIARAQSQLPAKNLLVMLPQKRCGGRPTARAVDHETISRLLKGTENGMRDRAEKAARLNVRIFHEVGRRIYGQTGYTV